MTSPVNGEANGTILSNANEIRQYAYHRNLGVANHTHWIHRTDGGGGFDFSSKNTVQFRFPLVLSYTNVIDEVDAVKVRFSPSFGFLWKANDNWTFGYYGMSQTSWEQLITAYIMRDYRTTSCYVANLTGSSSVKLDAKINYKDIMSSFFAYLQGTASRSWSDIIYGTAIDKNNHTVIQAEYMPHHNDIYSLTGNISKGFGWKDTKIEVNVGYTRNNGLVLRQSAPTDFHSCVYHIHGNASCNIINRIRIGYGCDYTYLSSMSQAYTHTIHTFSQRGNLDITIIPNSVLMNMTACHTHNGGFQGKKDYAFLDCSLTYRMKKKLELVLEVCNVFNTRTFVSRSDAELTESITEYHLLPRSMMFTTRFNI
ncbi:MAG: hypothetical protein NC206_02730 [Bacteroides sp.]|nr:hypothetical protein [Roseburia sp.]MCM1345978.1 hypothetical protein [Bacteroides sp.]MCM1419954.1 hypothetical protein [Bacteroides sp.]